jgi:hypothetical protein
MVFRRFGSSNSQSPLLASIPRLRNQLVARREALAAQERRLAKEIDKLRSQQDDLSNQLMQPNPSYRQYDGSRAGAAADESVGIREVRDRGG